jgi:hypothetical protein
MDFFDLLLTDWEDGQVLERKQNKTAFYKLMKERGFDFDDIDESTRLPKSLEPVFEGDADNLHKFNAAIAELHKKKMVNIVDSLIYLTADYLDEKQVLKFLDELNFYILKQELLKRFHIKKDKPETSLLDFLDADDE